MGNYARQMRLKRFTLILRILVIRTICGGAIAGAAPVALYAEVNREMWECVNASGTKRSKAVLVQIHSEKLLLRRRDGRLAYTTTDALSEPDRQYVASVQVDAQTEADATTLPEAALEKVEEDVESIQQLPQWLAGSQARAPRVSAAIVYVRVSRDFLEDYVERTVNRSKQVRDCVLGTRIIGESQTRGRTRLVLLPSNRQLLANIVFDGTVTARTRG
jgi:hypothetical protein